MDDGQNGKMQRLDTLGGEHRLRSVIDRRRPTSFLAWAAECLLNNGDGYWGGDHNFYVYDQGASGYVFFPTDLDSSLDYLGQFTSDPIYWWSARDKWLLPIPQHYLIMVGDAALRAQYTQALATQLPRLNVAQVQSWIDTASVQISEAVAADPHKPTGFMPGDFETAVTSPEAASSSAPITSLAGWNASRHRQARTATATSGAMAVGTTTPASIRAHQRSVETRSTIIATASSTRAAPEKGR